jgi:hypothetical protein
MAILSDLATSIGADSKNFRVNVYCYLEESFVLLSRVAKNPEWRKRGLSKIPMGWGVINRVWTEDKSVRIKLAKDRTEWEREMIEEGFPADLASKFRMQSRSFVGARIDARLPSERVPIGVLVMESVTPLGVNGRHLDRLLQDPLWKTLQDAMANAKEHFPEVARGLAQLDPE